ncbi:MAG: hypothetical protein HZB47_13900 [Nitrosomonadales bacterium]|nr:hypothetical protein [Nitrosomonadales bacterium]
MNKRLQPKGEFAPRPTCENCAHTIRKSGGQDMVVCVPHLKDMPGGNASVCDLHAMKNKTQESR